MSAEPNLVDRYTGAGIAALEAREARQDAPSVVPTSAPDAPEIDSATEARMTEQDAAEPTPPPAEKGADEPLAIATLALTGADLAKPLAPLEYLVGALAMPSGAGAAHCFAGYGFSGKSVAAQAMLLGLSAERAVWRAYTGPGRVIRCAHVDNEQGIALTQRRYQRCANAMGVSLKEIGDALRVFVFPKLTNGKRILLKPEHRSAWAELMADRDALLVDSLMASRDGIISENAAEVRQAIDMLSELAEATGCRPFIVHHANKVGDDRNGQERDARFALRGSGAIFDACDSVYLLTGAKGEAVKVEQIKARSHGEPIADFALVISDLERDGDVRWGLNVHVAGVELITEQREAKAETRAAAKLARDMARVRSALVGGKRLSRTELVADAHLSSGDFTRAWNALSEAHEVTRIEQKDGRTKSLIHFLTGATK